MKRKNKYNAIKTEVDGIKFDSKKEAARYQELKIMERAGIIKDLGRQIKFTLVPRQEDERPLSYIADFTYYDNEKKEMVVEDVKGHKTPLYIAKRKIFKYKYKEYKFLES